jgi:hypothetical protein
LRQLLPRKRAFVIPVLRSRLFGHGHAGEYVNYAPLSSGALPSDEEGMGKNIRIISTMTL